ncbi:MAG: histone deacetylase [Planctomycetes bacterium]|nr:histone deacetylase [Planctomycetota bacterium]
MSEKTALVYDDLFLEHRTGDHPECPERLVAIRERLIESGLWEGRLHVPPRPATDEEILRVHASEHLERLRAAAAGRGARLDPDTVMSERSFEVALLSAGGAISAAEAVLDGRVRRALALVRPPGHHATRDVAMGFCLLNNVAVAARHLRVARGVRRVAILDWDVHHGNGTQEIFYDDPTVLYLSFHRWPFYPGTGAADETGAGEGKGFTVNVPLSAGTPRAEYLDRFQTVLEEKVKPFAPEFVLVSAGFDAYRDDPIGGLGLETMDFATLTHCAVELAESTAEGRLVSVLEGGYDLGEMGRLVEAHLAALDSGGG